ncbi:MAG: hypothetical protein HRT40_00725 [Campylobacteraceae bacterium]|nr:hypothetical protein [Campylobacteraceae bacterium]
MRAIIQIGSKEYIKNDLNLIDDILFLKICGKMMISYYFDFLYQLGVKEVFIASNNPWIWKDKLSDIDKLNFKIKFIKSPSSKKSYSLNIQNFNNEDLIIIENFGFIKNNFNLINNRFFKSSQNTIFKDNSFKIFYIQNHLKNIDINSFKQKTFLHLKEMNTVEDYFFVSNLIFKNLNAKYFLLGYSNENGIVIGKNVEIERGCELIAPVIIMDNVKVCKNSKIGPNTVLNPNVFIESNCEITNSIVYDNTYINKNLKFEEKLILSNMIVDKNNKKVYNIDKKFVSENLMSLLSL